MNAINVMSKYVGLLNLGDSMSIAMYIITCAPIGIIAQNNCAVMLSLIAGIQIKHKDPNTKNKDGMHHSILIFSTNHFNNVFILRLSSKFTIY